ncbi:exoglucanase B-like [Anthonomus grandis grandis]|uniref:exoglucanase B-like n=1 Tax=Anthonomus grandis grandis TaxID=2921223 RepID=UPI002165C296|nr:exoglucanase B-like [Anthonomus grandis grandis]
MNVSILTLFSFFILNVKAEVYRDRFLEQYNKITNPESSYFSKDGVPYHTAETLVVESTDYGHETDSEAFSYNVYLKAVYGAITGDFEPFNDAWDMIERYMIPRLQTNSERYDPKNPGTASGITVGQDPIFQELLDAYNTTEVYIMHWLSDVDNIYGFGNIQGECELGPEANGPSFVNLGQGSLWEGFNTPTCDNFTYGGVNGFQFSVGNARRSYNYGAGPDADARAIQAAFWASQWANTSTVSETLDKAAKMGDFLRYTFFDQHFKRAGNCIGELECPGTTDKNSSHYLISWGISWGGSLEDKGYSWRSGNSVCYYGYQNLVAAYGLINEPSIRPKAATAVEDWTVSLERQLELYEYLQTSEGAFAAGVTNSWNKSYANPPQEYKDASFYGMWFDYQPGYADANPWFGFQAWTADRVAQYYYLTKNERARKIIKKWTDWIISEITFDENGDFTIPSNIKWDGLPPDTKVTVTAYGQSIGSASATARTLSYYAAASGDTTAKKVAKNLLDALWNHHRTARGISLEESFSSYTNFNHKLYIPLANWSGVYPNGDVIDNNATFLSVRSWFKDDPDWSMVQDYLDGGAVPRFEVHRFWEQSDVAVALGVYYMLFNE